MSYFIRVLPLLVWTVARVTANDYPIVVSIDGEPHQLNRNGIQSCGNWSCIGDSQLEVHLASKGYKNDNTFFFYGNSNEIQHPVNGVTYNTEYSVTHGLICTNEACSDNGTFYGIMSDTFNYTVFGIFETTHPVAARSVDSSKRKKTHKYKAYTTVSGQTYTLHVSSSPDEYVFVRSAFLNSGNSGSDNYVFPIPPTHTLTSVALTVYYCSGTVIDDECTSSLIQLFGTGPCLIADGFMTMDYVNQLRCEGGWPLYLLVAVTLIITALTFQVCFYLIKIAMVALYYTGLMLSWPFKSMMRSINRRKRETRVHSRDDRAQDPVVKPKFKTRRSYALMSVTLFFVCVPVNGAILPDYIPADALYFRMGTSPLAADIHYAFNHFDSVFGKSGVISNADMFVTTSEETICEPGGDYVTCTTHGSIRGTLPTVPGLCKSVRLDASVSTEDSAPTYVSICSTSIYDSYPTTYKYHSSTFEHESQCNRRCPGNPIHCDPTWQQVGGSFTGQPAECPGWVQLFSSCGCATCGCWNCGDAPVCCKIIFKPLERYTVEALGDPVRHFDTIVRIDSPVRSGDDRIAVYQTIFTVVRFSEGSPGLLNLADFTTPTLGFNRENEQKLIHEDLRSVNIKFQFEGAFSYTAWQLSAGYKVIRTDAGKVLIGPAADVGAGIPGGVGWVQSPVKIIDCNNVPRPKQMETINTVCPHNDICHFLMPQQPDFASEAFRTPSETVSNALSVVTNDGFTVSLKSGPPIAFGLTIAGGWRTIQYATLPCPVVVIGNMTGCYKCNQPVEVSFSARSDCGAGVTSVSSTSGTANIVGVTLFSLTSEFQNFSISLMAEEENAEVGLQFSGKIPLAQTWQVEADPYNAIPNATDPTVEITQSEGQGGGFGNWFSNWPSIGLNSILSAVIKVILISVLGRFLVWLLRYFYTSYKARKLRAAQSIVKED